MDAKEFRSAHNSLVKLEENVTDNVIFLASQGYCINSTKLAKQAFAILNNAMFEVVNHFKSAFCDNTVSIYHKLIY